MSIRAFLARPWGQQSRATRFALSVLAFSLAVPLALAVVAFLPWWVVVPFALAPLVARVAVWAGWIR